MSRRPRIETGVLVGDALSVLRGLPSNAVQCCVTSPPYWLKRDYGVEGQIGLEPVLGDYVERLRAVFREVRRVLRDDGVLWLVLGDSYAGSFGAQGRQGATSQLVGRSALAERQIAAGAKKRLLIRPELSGLKSKDLAGVPWRVAFALRDDGWYLRSDVIWHKRNPMPESVLDRPSLAHEYVFLFSKSPAYYYDADAIREPVSESTIARGRDKRKRENDLEATAKIEGASSCGVNTNGRNARSVWTLSSEPYDGEHFAPFPSEIPRRGILAGSRLNDVVLDPFVGAGTTVMVAHALGRRYVGIELNPASAELANLRIFGPLYSKASR